MYYKLNRNLEIVEVELKDLTDNLVETLFSNRLQRGTKEIHISTVFLGIDHNFYGDTKGPVLFESMVFMSGFQIEEGTNERQYRYRTYREAEMAHNRLVKNYEIWIKKNG